MTTAASGSSTPLSQLSDNLRQIDLTGHPPVDKWQPKLRGSIDIFIKKNGEWLHEGSPFQREKLVNLFASILWQEDGKHYLRTPAEQLLIEVEEAPFFVSSLDIVDRGTEHQQLVFTTTYGDIVIAGPDNHLWIEEDSKTGEPSPYLTIRYGMKGKLSRNVFYELADIVEYAPCPPDTNTPHETNDCLFVYSQGTRFNLGASY
uniref:FIG003620: Proteophosphoglycan n=1 Tax=uncultured Thiotrichaceae bacterium TaxID=298394 RepID=A0A6S6TRX2_9GAMM